MKTSHHFTAAKLFVFSLFLSLQVANAALYTFTAVGKITSLTDPYGEFTGIAIGDDFTTTSTYNTDNTDITASSDIGWFQDDLSSNPLLEASITVHTASGDQVFTIPNYLNINTANTSGADNVQIIGPTFSDVFLDPRIDIEFLNTLFFQDNTATALSSDNFPSFLKTSGNVDLSPWGSTEMLMQYVDNDPGPTTFGEVRGDITSITVVPEPSTLYLPLLCFCAAYILRRKS